MAAFYPTQRNATDLILVPHVNGEVAIDGDLSEWKTDAYHDGTWSMDRIKQAPWYEPKRNRLVIDVGEDSNSTDLEAKYYMAWDDNYLYFGAEVIDNHNDVMDSKHEAKRWYYKDAIALFMEIPKDTVSERFADGDHAFCFVADTSMPSYGAWWRHGDRSQSYLEEELPVEAVSYVVKLTASEKGVGDYVLEARIKLSALITEKDIRSLIGQDLGFMIVHCDPDGGEYGGHLLIYGKGDDDQSWGTMRFIEADEE